LKLAPISQLIERHAIARGVDPKIALGSVSNIPMGGNVFPVGIYWLEVGIGTPTKYYGVAIDSGYVFLRFSNNELCIEALFITILTTFFFFFFFHSSAFFLQFMYSDRPWLPLQWLLKHCGISSQPICDQQGCAMP
jgi:hypothetical protein